MNGIWERSAAERKRSLGEMEFGWYVTTGKD